MYDGLASNEIGTPRACACRAALRADGRAAPASKTDPNFWPHFALPGPKSPSQLRFGLVFWFQMTSKMDPKIVEIQGSVKVAFLQPLSIENLVFEVPGPPKSDPKSFKNVIGNWIASKTSFFSLQRLSKCKSVAQGSNLVPKWGDYFVTESSQIGLWPKEWYTWCPKVPKWCPKAPNWLNMSKKWHNIINKSWQHVINNGHKVFQNRGSQTPFQEHFSLWHISDTTKWSCKASLTHHHHGHKVFHNCGSQTPFQEHFPLPFVSHPSRNTFSFTGSYTIRHGGGFGSACDIG